MYNSIEDGHVHIHTRSHEETNYNIITSSNTINHDLQAYLLFL